MYLITVEGGDGSGKGLAAKVIAHVIEKEFTFSTHLLIVNAIFFAFLNYQLA